jgi:hypothetical protein
MSMSKVLSAGMSRSAMRTATLTKFPSTTVCAEGSRERETACALGEVKHTANATIKKRLKGVLTMSSFYV